MDDTESAFFCLFGQLPVPASVLEVIELEVVDRRQLLRLRLPGDGGLPRGLEHLLHGLPGVGFWRLGHGRESTRESALQPVLLRRKGRGRNPSAEQKLAGKKGSMIIITKIMIIMIIINDYVKLKLRLSVY